MNIGGATASASTYSATTLSTSNPTPIVHSNASGAMDLLQLIAMNGIPSVAFASLLGIRTIRRQRNNE